MRHLPVAAVALAALGAMPASFAANLSDIYARARAEDAQFAAAVHAADAGREKRAQGHALLLPSVSVSGNYRRAHDASNSYTGYVDYNAGAANVTATQQLMRQAYRATSEQGELQAQLADQQLALAEQDLLVRVSRGYFEVLQAQDALATVGAQKEAFAQQLAQAKRSYEVGLAPVTDVNEAQTRYDLTLAQEIAGRNELEFKRRTLEKFINGPLPTLSALDPEASIDVLSAAQLQSLSEGAETHSAQVEIGITGEKIARIEVAKQDAGHNPTIDVVASYGTVSNGNYGMFGSQNTKSASIGLEVSVPIYQGGGVSSRAREAVANMARAQSELDNARRQARLDARQALLGVQSGIALTQALRQAVKSGETQVRSTRRGLEVGVRTRVDVLNAEQQLFTTRRDLSAARYQALISGLLLKSHAGVIGEPDLKGLDAMLKD
jgi:outer membrane protein